MYSVCQLKKAIKSDVKGVLSGENPYFLGLGAKNGAWTAFLRQAPKLPLFKAYFRAKKAGFLYSG